MKWEEAHNLVNPLEKVTLSHRAHCQSLIELKENYRLLDIG
jgi:hypothetical protein